MGSRVGEFLREHRKQTGESLQGIVERFSKADGGGKALSKQSLSLIERGRLGIAEVRVSEVIAAYNLNDEEGQNFRSLVDEERLHKTTTELDRYVDLIRSKIGLTQDSPAVLYFIGGKRLPFESPTLQKLAADFLTSLQGNEMMFFYPSRLADSDETAPFWPRNSMYEIRDVHRAITTAAKSKHIASGQLRFFQLDEQKHFRNPLIREAYALCGPMTTFTVIRPSKTDQSNVAAIAYIRGATDTWVLLDQRDALKMLELLSLLLKGHHKGIIEDQVKGIIR